MRCWYLKCPHCGAVLEQGDGYGEKFPIIGEPFFRCPVCGKLIKTGSMEYLALPIERRTRIHTFSSLEQPIKQSLDRTNSPEYVEFLKKHGYRIFPISNEDIRKYPAVKFGNIVGKKPSQKAIEGLKTIGVLIQKDLIDPRTGGYRQDVLEENYKEYEKNRKTRRILGVFTLISTVAFTLAFAAITPMLSILGLLVGLALPFGVYCLIYCIANKKKKSESEPKKTHQASAPPPAYQNDVAIRNIEYMKKLYYEGIITQEEYYEKVRKILKDNNM